MEFEEREEHEEEEEEEDEEEDEDEEDDSEAEIELPVGLSERLIRMSNSGGEAAVVTPTIRKVRYRECLKNHAVGIGGHAVDGCGEFMPAGTEGTLDALKCAACNCHRNFHRKENEVAAIISAGGEGAYHRQQQQHQQQQQQFSPYYRTQTGYLHMGAPHHRPPPLALPSTSGEGRGPMSREAAPDQEDRSNPNNGSGGGGGGTTTATTMMMTSGSGSPKKRFRTKFTTEQKDRMVTLAERLGWRIQKHDEDIVQQFCNESGVKRHVLKVWMHNNKHTLGKKST